MPQSLTEKLIALISKCKNIDEKIELFNIHKEHLTKEILAEAEKHEAANNRLISISESINKG